MQCQTLKYQYKQYLTTESFIENNENAQNIAKISQIFSHLKEHKTFYGIRTYKNTENLENIRTCVILSENYSHLRSGAIQNIVLLQRYIQTCLRSVIKS